LIKVAAVHSIPVETPRKEFRKKGHQKLLSDIKVQPQPSRLQLILQNLRSTNLRSHRKYSLAQIAIAAVLAFCLVTGGVAYASDGAVPGDPLYGLDRALENIQLGLTSNPDAVAALRLKLAEERLAEAEDRLLAGDVENGQVALDAYGAEISALAQLVAGPEGVDQDALTELVKAAQEVHLDVLSGLLDKVPEQAQDAIQQAIDSSEKNRKNPGPPKDVGPPDDAGKPEDVGPPEDKGKPADPGSQGSGE
jgi:hypothetical protein